MEYSFTRQEKRAAELSYQGIIFCRLELLYHIVFLILFISLFPRLKWLLLFLLVHLLMIQLFQKVQRDQSLRIPEDSHHTTFKTRWLSQCAALSVKLLV